MKRFLSIILIAAALFGLYGDYVNITDIFKCKNYWEETSKKSEDDLNKLGAGLTKLKKNKKSYTKAVKQLAKGKRSLAAAEAKYATVGAKMSKLKSDYKKGVNKYKDMSELIKDISTVRTEYKSWKSTYDKLNNSKKNVTKALSGPDPDKKGTAKDLLLVDTAVLIDNEGEKTTFTSAVNALENDEQTANGYKIYAANCDIVVETVDSLYKREAERYNIADTIYKYDANGLVTVLKESQEIYDTAVKLEMIYLEDEELARFTVDGAKDGNMTDAKEIIKDAKSIRSDSAKHFRSLKWLKYYVTSTMKTCSTNAKNSADKLAKGQDKIAKQIASISSAILGNSAYKNAVKKEMGKKAIKMLENLSKKPNPLKTSSITFAAFETQMDENPGLNASLLKAQKLLNSNRADLKKAVTKVKSSYTASYRAYKAYPKKLETARAKLEKLEKDIATYEAGEKASKKGLTALVNEKPDGDLESIKDRVGGSENFDDSKGHLDIDKGMEAVDAGEAYLNERGDDITKEITGRIIGTVLGIISAVLALLAALLSLFKSNRGAAIISCIAAVTAAGGAALGEAAGEIYSILAGSTVGELPWIAVMTLAGVAMIFAIVHFSAKIEEPLADE